MRRLIFSTASLLGLAGCFAVAGRLRPDAPAVPERAIDPSADIAAPAGHTVEAVAIGLTFPAGITFDEEGTPYIIETGFAYGDVWDEPRLIRLDKGGGKTVIATGKDPPWTGVDYANGAFYVAANGEVKQGKILRITKDGAISVLVDGLPGYADHHVNGPVVGPDGYVYFSQGVATNAAVVGLDNHQFGWVAKRPDFADIPCKDIKLVGQNFETENPLTPDEGDKAVTGAFLPFGTPSTPGQIIKGKVPCTGAVMRVGAEGGAVELVAWGFRNPFGLAFSPDGKLYVTDNGYDERGSRPIYGSADWLWEVDVNDRGTWYGWPDFAGGIPIGDRFDKSTMKEPQRLLAEIPNPPPMAKAQFAVHSSADGIAIAPNDHFVPRGTAIVAEFGDMAPNVGKTYAPVGYRVVMVDPKTGVISPFVTNVGKGGPASMHQHGGLERPVDVGFSPDGNELYVVDFGVMGMGEPEGEDEVKPLPQKSTGVVWRVTRSDVAVATR